MGIKRDSLSKSGHSTTIDDRITSARGCAYSLMGTGLHGENGGNPRVSLSLWSTYVLPRLTYGLDVLTLSKSEVQKLNQFHKKFLKQVMHLQERTAYSAVYLLSGQLPLVADLQSGFWVRWAACFAVAQLREKLQNATAYTLITNNRIQNTT